MDKLKGKIIRYFILCVFGVSITENALDSIFNDYILPPMAEDKPMLLIMLFVCLFLTVSVYAIFGVLFLRLTSKAINSESKRQVSERNMRYSRICHDLKTPMTSVQGFAAALRDGKIKPEEQQEIFSIIYRKSYYMNELVESMFAYSKLDTEEFQLSFKKRDLGSLVRGIVALHYDEFEKRKMILQLDIPDDPLFCSLDEKEMKRCISNLVVNAYKHNPNGTTVMIQVCRREKDAYVVVADNGVLIPTEQECCIFEPFISGDEARSSGNGNGLGLTISRIIARKHGGNLYIRKDIDGCTKGFVIQIPSVV